MSEKYICGGSKYYRSKYYRGGESDTIFMPISFDDLPEEVEVNGIKLYLKDEFHVSLVYTKKLIDRHDISISDFGDRVKQDFCDFVKENKVDVSRYLDKYYLVTKNDRTTVIVMCEVSNLNDFFDFLNKKYDLNINYPIHHLTLYTDEGGLGVFLMGEDLDKYAVPINNPVERDL